MKNPKLNIQSLVDVQDALSNAAELKPESIVILAKVDDGDTEKFMVHVLSGGCNSLEVIGLLDYAYDIFKDEMWG